ncbi:ATP-binding protein [Streptomyces sp. NRRL S-813]|uniref:ATP-binding protein n=1 Tax=Streptomyces sp. NRRL S-813 TaxID=1463919 RepID=UPI00056D6F94|nr:ATP-binding protein [Streptomyces sp. NRRL S-813]
MTPTRPSATGTAVRTALLPNVPEAVMTDAVAHTTSTTTRIAVEQQPDCRIRIEVMDISSTESRPDRPEDTSEYGRGLLVVDALSSRWGVTRHQGGKPTWPNCDPYATADRNREYGVRST